MQLYYSELTKYDENGEVIWSQVYNEGNSFFYMDFHSDLIETHDGNIVIVGRNIVEQENQNDLTLGHIMKVNSETGDIIWDHDYGREGDYLKFSTVVESNDDLIVVGYGSHPNDFGFDKIGTGVNYLTIIKFEW